MAYHTDWEPGQPPIGLKRTCYHEEDDEETVVMLNQEALTSEKEESPPSYVVKPKKKYGWKANDPIFDAKINEVMDSQTQPLTSQHKFHDIEEHQLFQTQMTDHQPMLTLAEQQQGESVARIDSIQSEVEAHTSCLRERLAEISKDCTNACELIQNDLLADDGEPRHLRDSFLWMNELLEKINGNVYFAQKYIDELREQVLEPVLHV